MKEHLKKYKYTYLFILFVILLCIESSLTSGMTTEELERLALKRFILFGVQ